MADDDCDSEIDEGLNQAISFLNFCTVSQVFITFGGCNACGTTRCQGMWVLPNQALPIDLPVGQCTIVSAFARTPNGDFCLDADGNGNTIGQTRPICAQFCSPGVVGMNAQVPC